MNPRTHAVRVGLARGWTEAKLSLRAPDDIAFYLLWGVGLLVFLYLNRDAEVEGTALSFPALAMPGVLAAMTVFGGIVGPAFQLVIEREDGTLLRAKAAPHGVKAYMVGQVTLQSFGVVPMMVILLVPSAFLFDGLMYRGALGWLAVAGLILLGLVVSLPLGMILGSLARKPSHVTTWGLLPVIGMAMISGIFTPLSTMWGWVQGLAQALPLFWLGHGLRWAFLPAEAAVMEPGEQWRIAEALGVLGTWAVVGLVLAPIVLRRMARRESGSAVQERMHESMQRIA